MNKLLFIAISLSFSLGASAGVISTSSLFDNVEHHCFGLDCDSIEGEIDADLDRLALFKNAKLITERANDKDHFFSTFSFEVNDLIESERPGSFTGSGSNAIGAINDVFGFVNDFTHDVSVFEPISPKGEVADVPEPGSLALLGVGLLGLGMARRQQKKADDARANQLAVEFR